jgi:hypothetical protein
MKPYFLRQQKEPAMESRNMVLQGKNRPDRSPMRNREKDRKELLHSILTILVSVVVSSALTILLTLNKC